MGTGPQTVPPRFAGATAAEADPDERTSPLSNDARAGLDGHAASVPGLEDIDADVEDALERVRVPAYVVDRHGIVRWENRAALAIFGDVRGKQITSLVAPEERRRAREIFFRNLTGPPEGSDNKAVAHD